MSLFNELKRRNVFKVTIAYIFMAWLVMQVADVILNNIIAPEWVFHVVLLFLAIGFPLAVFFAWEFELTPEGLKREHEVDRSQSITTQTSRKLDFIIIGVMAVALAYFAYDKLVLSAERDAALVEATTQAVSEQVVTEQEESAEPDKSIAVLAFLNMSADPEQEYFSDGIAEEILNGLAQLPDLRVAARTSAFSFKGQNIDIRQVGETLNVNYVLEGSVRKAGDRLRITAQLISVDDGYHLWSETYNRQMDDIFAIQEEIARAVVGALEVTLGLAEETSLVQQGTTNTEAYNWYLRGRYYIERQTSNAFEKAIESYSRGIELDPGFAGGHGGLAYGLAYGALFYPYSQVAETVRPAYRRALEIDENQVEALLAKSVDALLTDFNYIAAEQAIRKALATGANRTIVTDAYWWVVFQYQRRFDEALELLTIAEEADPLSSLVKQGLGYIHWVSGDSKASLPYLEAALELNPNDFLAGFVLSNALVDLGQYEEAESTITQVEVLAESNALSLSSWATLYRARDEGNKAQEVLEQMLVLYNDGNQDPALVPMIGAEYARNDNFEEAMIWYERAYEMRSPFSGTLAIWTHPESAFWNHPDFRALMKKMNLDDASVAEARAAAAGQF